ncbi:RNA polymerase sigma factor SigE [Cellulosimicrobium arenosum]|uniref:RNA polymerase sigma factor SigE n=1 Tax=Cellulosimicrobium arenosum TaxID=2708133 RepID=UPI0030CA2EA2
MTDSAERARTSPRTPAGATGRDDGWVAPSWDEIVREHSGRVYRLAYRLTGDRHDAEDLTQETFVRVFRSLAGYTPGTFEGWLHRITTNLFLDQVRRKQRIRMEAMGEDDGRYPQRGDAGQPERGFEHANLDHDVQRALDALSPEYRAAVVLCDIEGLSYEEIAVTLGIKLGTVRSRIHRARAQLRDALGHRDPASRPQSETLAPRAADGPEGTGAPRVLHPGGSA